jgi:serine/threonine protein kinase
MMFVNMLQQATSPFGFMGFVQQPPGPPMHGAGQMVMAPHPHSSRGAGEGALQPGVEVRLGQRMFRILYTLGSGSFSTVWAAAPLDGGGEVAIKETLCRSPEELQDAENEGQILQMVGNVAATPGFFGCETLQLASGVTSVRLAMAKVAGDSLGAYLQKWKQSWRSDPFSQFTEACNFTCELLVQLVPAMDAISAVAMHRDVNTHNVLVTTGNRGRKPEFSVIDFGLAMSLPKWEQMCSKVPVVGDCRYWPVSAWYIFAHGGPKLKQKSGLFAEYKTQVDLHAFGLTALQVFIDMLPQPTSSAVPEEIWELKAAWEQYWQNAYHLWEPLYNAFERRTDWNQLRQSYIQNEAHKIIDKDLGNLRRVLYNARDACAHAEPGSVVAKVAVVFSALVELISQGAKPLGREAPKGNIKLASWSDIADILDNSDRSLARCDSNAHGRALTTSFTGRTSSSTTLPSNSMPVATTSTPVPAYLPTTITPFPQVGMCMPQSPIMVMHGVPTAQMSFMPGLVRWP